MKQKDKFKHIKSKNKKTLNDFIKYCKKNPSLRFWQALRNWAKVPNLCIVTNEGKDITDTFYFEGKNS